ncbi:MAG TPA: CHAP domain-containing protein [Candidatus Angelobacter sp.]|nr:CHAP domain-containing protein [Candidatus Angelobacter sp.]
MKGAAFGGCGCVVVAGFLVLSAPLLFFGAGGGAPADAAAPVADKQIIPAGGSSCDAAVRCQPRPAELHYVPFGYYPDTYTTPTGECTSWAAALWPGHRGQGVTWSGDAWAWYGNAAAQGYDVSSSPSLGAIVVFRRTPTGSGAWGHVAVVISVAPSTVRVTEMNVIDRFVVDERTVAIADAGIAGFIPVPADAFA